MITYQENEDGTIDVIYSATADAFNGVQQSGAEYRQYTDVRISAAELAVGPEDLTPGSRAWWEEVLTKLGDYRVFCLEARPETLDALAHALGFADFTAWEYSLQSNDLDTEAYHKGQFLSADETA